MNSKIFYNSSLPRSGSTLIQNILAQNPDIYASPTSGVYEMLSACRTIFTDGLEFKAQEHSVMNAGFKSFLKKGLYGFYEPITERKWIIDKCRGWGAEYNFINEFDPEPKIICMIRDIRAIYSSMEKKYRSNPMVDHHIANWGNLTGTTTDKRIVIWSNNPPIGPSMDRLYQILLEGLHKFILFIKFEDLCKEPETQLQRIYEYLEIPYFKHDFQNIEQFTKEDDKWYGIFGDHMIRQELKPVKDDFHEVLGETGCKLIEDAYPWFFNDFGYKI